MTEELDMKFENEDETNRAPKEDTDSHEHVPEDLDEYLEGFCSDEGDSVSRDRIAGNLESIDSRLERIDDHFQKVSQEFESRTQTLEHYLEIVAECQRETAKSAKWAKPIGRFG